MDTIQIAIVLKKEELNVLTLVDLIEIKRYINGITSDYGHKYCDYLQRSNTESILVKISYPRFFAGINAYLISNSMECLQVHWHFSLSINEHPLIRGRLIKIARVDVPFTFMMETNSTFNSYRKIYQVLDYVYRKKNIKANPKAYTNVSEYKPETIIYADTPTLSKSNKKIMIYDQFNNLKSKTDDEKRFYNLNIEYKDLSKRMRIEVSKRIDRNEFSIYGFSQYDIFKEYSKKYRKYLLENLFDLNEVDEFYENKAEEFAKKLLSYREETSNFTYETFIYKEIEYIHDYEIIRRALKMCINNLKTREKAVTAVRKVLIAYQFKKNIIVMDTYETIKKMREQIINYYPE